MVTEYRLNGKLYAGSLHDAVTAAKAMSNSAFSENSTLVITTESGRIDMEFTNGKRTDIAFSR